MIPKSLSLYLDFLRVVAALIVFIYHSDILASLDRGRMPTLLNLESGRSAHLAVIVFFVLSGYLISFSASKPGLDWKKFLIERLGRLYSVLLPALIFTAMTMLLIKKVDPEIYVGLTVNGHTASRFLVGILFLQQVWWACVIPGGLVVIWSLGYEFWYYILMGLWQFVAVTWIKWSLILLVLLLIGPKIILLLFTWLCGVLAQRCPVILRSTTQTKKIIFCTTSLLMVGALAFADCIPLWQDAIGRPPLYYSANWIIDCLFAPIVALNLWAFPREGRNILSVAKLDAPLKYLAASSFSIYLYHTPLFYIYSLYFKKASHWAGEVLFLAGTLLACILLSLFTERNLLFYRRIVDKFLSPLLDRIPARVFRVNSCGLVR